MWRGACAWVRGGLSARSNAQDAGSETARTPGPAIAGNSRSGGAASVSTFGGEASAQTDGVANRQLDGVCVCARRHSARCVGLSRRALGHHRTYLSATARSPPCDRGKRACCIVSMHAIGTVRRVTHACHAVNVSFHCGFHRRHSSLRCRRPVSMSRHLVPCMARLRSAVAACTSRVLSCDWKLAGADDTLRTRTATTTSHTTRQ